MVTSLRFMLVGFFIVARLSLAAAQVWTYPFTNGVADLPEFSLATGDSVRMPYLIVNPTPQPVWVMLSVFADEMKVFRLDSTGPVLLGQTGQIVPGSLAQVNRFDQRYNGNTIRIPIAARSRIKLAVLYSKRANEGILHHRPRLFTEAAYEVLVNEFYASDQFFQMQTALFWGLLLMMLLYTLLQFNILRQSVLLYYSFYLFCTLCRSILAIGYFSWIENWPFFRDIGFIGRFSLTFLFWSLAAYSLFIREFAQFSQRFKWYDQVCLWASWIFLGLGFMDVFFTVDRLVIPTWRHIYTGLTLVMIGFGLHSLYMLWHSYNSVVKYAFWGVFFFTLTGIASQLNQWLNQDGDLFKWEASIYSLGYVLEILAFSSGLAKRQQIALAERLAFQEQLIHQLQENEHKRLQLQRIRDDIARDLHDEIGSDLSGISIMSTVAVEQVDRFPNEAKTTLNVIGETTRTVLSSMRDIVWSLNSTQDYVDNLILRLQESAHSLFEFTPITLHQDMPLTNRMISLKPQYRRDFLLIYKEILHNIVRHAEAQTVYIRVTLTDSEIELCVQDDGIGFDLSQGPSTGTGLKNIQQRVSKLGGLLTIQSKPGEGSVLGFRCPVQNLTSENLVQSEGLIPISEVI